MSSASRSTSVTLLSLSLVVGILVDDAIVEIENIMRHLRMGKTPFDAAMEAADEIGLAVIATTFTLIAVFLPTAFMSRRGGQVLRAVRLDGGHRRVLQPGGGAHAHADDGGLHPEAAEEGVPANPCWMRHYLGWARLVPEATASSPWLATVVFFFGSASCPGAADAASGFHAARRPEPDAGQR